MRRLCFILIFLCLNLCSNVALSQIQSKIPFYIPVNSNDYPKLKHKLDAALFKVGLGQFATQTTDYWHTYRQGIKQGRIGVYLAAPHFVAWVTNKHNFTPLLKLESNAQYVLASRSTDINLFEVDDLNNRPVCTQSSLNLDFILVNQAFTNPLYSAQVKIVSDVAKEINRDNKDCHAFSIANHLFIKHNLAHPESLIRLQQGPSWPPYAWVLHPELDSHKQVLIKFLRSETALEILSPIIQTFSEGNRILNTIKEDYPAKVTKPLDKYWVNE